MSLTNKRKRVNLQFRKGFLTQQYGKANTNVPEIFTKPIDILTERLKNHIDLEWRKEKYDFLHTDYQ